MLELLAVHLFSTATTTVVIVAQCRQHTNECRSYTHMLYTV